MNQVKLNLIEPIQGKTAISYEVFQNYVNAASEGSIKNVPSEVVVIPTYMTAKAVGADCFASEEVVIPPGTVKPVPTGFKASFDGEELGLFAHIRSSIPGKKGLMLANGVGVIEEDYYGNPKNDGDIGFLFYNYTDKPVTVERFERLGQLVLAPIERFENAGRAYNQRGASGSTGK